MAKRRKSSKCPEPINALLDVAGAATLGLYVKHKVKKDFDVLKLKKYLNLNSDFFDI